MDDREMIDIEEHLQRSIGSEEVGMPTEKWVAVLEEMRQLRKENKALREQLAQPVHAIDMSQERVDGTAKREREWVGLTDEDIYKVIEKNIPPQLNTLFDMVKWVGGVIEAKLKEKNT